jgi:predicted nucleic acid-binding protein
MIAVLDASAAIEIALQREKAQKFTPHVAAADWVIAPTLFIAEVTNVFWKYQKYADVPFLACEQGIEQAMSLPDDFIDEKDLYREAFKLACNLDHSVYDMLYLVVARRNNATLLTLDKKLLKAARKCSIDIVD